jgi:hypothetical protein
MSYSTTINKNAQQQLPNAEFDNVMTKYIVNNTSINATNFNMVVKYMCMKANQLKLPLQSVLTMVTASCNPMTTKAANVTMKIGNFGLQKMGLKGGKTKRRTTKRGKRSRRNN